jgi:hypothetical protein
MSTSKLFSTGKMKLAFVALLVMAGLFIYPSSSTYAKTKKAKYGTIKILSTPGGLPISVDGKSFGATTTEYRALDFDPGLHTVVITLPNGQLWTREIDLSAGRIKCVAVNYRPLPVPPKSPCPFPVNVSAPSQVNEGEIITYTSDVSYIGTAGLTHTWTISPSNVRIVSGAGTPTITVDSTGLAGKRISATLVVSDGSADPACRQSALAYTNISPLEKRVIVGREFDTCCSCSYDDQKARLDNLAIELQNDPTTTTYIFGYSGRTSPNGEADRLLARARDYLVSQRGIDGNRVILVNGGFREENCVEVWIVPQGAKSPQPSPTVQPGDVRPAPASRPRRRGRG